MCVHEYHAMEPGWHCHVDRNGDRAVAHWNHQSLKRWPSVPLRSASYDVTSRESATAIALKVYSISAGGTLL
jgi:hypothetical protein